MMTDIPYLVFMPRGPLPRSVCKFIRKEKARIRREFFDIEQAEKKIQELVSEFKSR